MIRLVLISIMMIWISGCAAHYYKVQGDTLSIYLDKPDAQEVVFACSLDGFEPHDARCEDGRWEITMPYEEPFRYYYRVDGSLFLPPCQLQENDDFGYRNCIFDPNL